MLGDRMEEAAVAVEPLPPAEAGCGGEPTWAGWWVGCGGDELREAVSGRILGVSRGEMVGMLMEESGGHGPRRA